MEESPGMEPYHVRNKMNRRVWTRPEEDVLLYELKKLVANGWRVDNAFRTGYLLALEHALAKRFPGANITGNKHINSKLTVWKKAYKLLFAMFQNDGFRFEPATKMIVVDSDEVWNNYVKGHRDVEHMRFKAFPFYKDWCEVFGNDIIIDNAQGFVDALEDLHPNQGSQQAVLEPPPGYVSRFNVMPETEAQGFGDAIQDLHPNKNNQPGYVSHFNVMPETEAQGFGDAFQDLQSNKGKQPAIEISPASFVDAISDDDARSIAQNETSGGSTRNHRSSKKATPSRKRKAEVSAPPEPPPDPVAQVVGDFLKDMNSACGDLLKKFNLDQDTSADKAKRLLFALGNIPGISDEAQVLVSYKLANNPIVMELFLNMNGGLRAKFVQMLLDGKLS